MPYVSDKGKRTAPKHTSRPARKSKPPVVKPPQGDIASSGGDYGTRRAKEYSASQAFRGAIRKTYNEQSPSRRKQVSAGAQRQPGPAAAVIRHEHSTRAAASRRAAGLTTPGSVIPGLGQVRQQKRSEAAIRLIQHLHNQVPISTTGDTKSGLELATAESFKATPRYQTDINAVAAAAAAKRQQEVEVGLATSFSPEGIGAEFQKLGAKVNLPLAALKIAGLVSGGGGAGENKPGYKNIPANALREAIDIPAQAVPSTYRSLEPLAHGDVKKTVKNYTQFYEDLYHKPYETATKNPLSTYLAVRGPIAGASRALGKGARLTGAIPDQRPSAIFPNTALTLPRYTSRGILSGAYQTIKDKPIRRGEKPRPVMTRSQVKRASHEDEAKVEEIRRIDRERAAIHANEAVGKKPSVAHVLGVQNIVNNIGELKAYHGQLVDFHNKLAKKIEAKDPDAIRNQAKLPVIRENIDNISNFLDRKDIRDLPNDSDFPQKMREEIESYKALSSTQQNQLGELYGQGSRLDTARLIPYARQRMGATFERNTWFDTQTKKVISAQEARDLKKDLPEKDYQERVQRQSNVLVSPEKKILSNEDIRAHMQKQHGPMDNATRMQMRAQANAALDIENQKLTRLEKKLSKKYGTKDITADKLSGIDLKNWETQRSRVSDAQRHASRAEQGITVRDVAKPSTQEVPVIPKGMSKATWIKKHTTARADEVSSLDELTQNVKLSNKPGISVHNEHIRKIDPKTKETVGFGKEVQGSEVAVARDSSGKVIGAIRAVGNKKNPILEAHVHPAHQGKGIAKQLYDALEKKGWNILPHKETSYTEAGASAAYSRLGPKGAKAKEFTPNSRSFKQRNAKTGKVETFYESGRGSLDDKGHLHTWYEGEGTHGQRMGHNFSTREDFMISPEGRIRIHSGSGKLDDVEIVARAIHQDPRLKPPLEWELNNHLTKSIKEGGLKESWEKAVADAQKIYGGRTSTVHIPGMRTETRPRTVGITEPGYISQAPNPRSAAAHFVNPNKAQSITPSGRTGEATVQGSLNLGKEALRDSYVRGQGLITAAEQFSKRVARVAIRKANAKVPDDLADDVVTDPAHPQLLTLQGKRNADQFARDYNTRHPEAPIASIQIQPFGGGHGQVGELLDRANSDEHLGQLAEKSMNDALEGIDASGQGNFAFIPKAYQEEMVKYLGSEKAPLRRMFGSQFRRVVLSTSPRWLVGNVAEASLRSAIERAGPRSLWTGKRIMAELKKINPELHDELMARAAGSGHYGIQRRASIYSGSEHFEDASSAAVQRMASSIGWLIRKPVIRVVPKMWDAWTDFVFNKVNSPAESNFQQAMLGRAVREHLMSDKLMKLSKKAMRDAINDIQDIDTIASLGREVDRMYGKYSKFSPFLKRRISYETPFIAWYLNSLRFIFHSLPKNHPVVSALLASSYVATDEWRKDHGLSLFMEKNVPYFLQGGIPRPEGTLRMPYTPFSAVSDPLGTPGGLLFPQFQSIIFALDGKDWKGDDIKGYDNNVALGAIEAIKQLTAMLIPGSRQAQAYFLERKEGESELDRARRAFGDPFKESKTPTQQKSGKGPKYKIGSSSSGGRGQYSISGGKKKSSGKYKIGAK